MPNLIQTATVAAVDRSKTQGIYTALTPFIHTQTTNSQVTLGYQRAGSVVILLVLISSTTVIPSGVVSSKGADGTPNALWQPMSTAVTDAALGTAMVTFMGVVNNPGNDIITLSFTGGTPVNTIIGLDLFEFNGGMGPNATWILDVVSSADKAASTTVSFPGHSIRYAVTELFFSACYSSLVMTPVPSSGMVFDNGSIYGAEVVYNLAYPTGSVGATATQASSVYLQMSATLAVANVQDYTDTTVTIDFSDKIPTGLMWVVYQVSFEIVTALGVGSPSAQIYLNGRTIDIAAVPGATKGPPFYTVRPGDNFYMVVTGAPLGAEIDVDVLYQEWPNGAPLQIAGVV